MTLMRWYPTAALSRDWVSYRDEVDRLVDGFFRAMPLQRELQASFTPPGDVEETPEDFVVRVDLPGMSQKDVRVSLTGDTLTIRGERKHEQAHHEGSLHRMERVYGTFERTFTLGVPVRGEKIKAVYKDGVLEVRVPKAEAARPREIDVQVG